MAKMKTNYKLASLASRIEKLSYKLDLTKELVELERDRLNKKLEEEVSRLKYKNSKELLELERKAMNTDELFEIDNKKKIEKFDNGQSLVYREKRQSLRRAENLLDKNNNVIGELNSGSKNELESLKETQIIEKQAFITELKSTYPLYKERENGYDENAALLAYEEKKATFDAEVSAKTAELHVELEKKLADFEAKTNTKIVDLENKLSELMPEFNALNEEEKERNKNDNLPSDVILRLESLTMQFGGLKAVNDLSFDVKKGEIFGLIGPNGAGKTTVFNCITQFYKPTSGKVWYVNNKNELLYMNDFKVHDVIKTGIVRTFQNVEVISDLTILENLLIAAHIQFRTNIFNQMFNSKQLRREEAILRKKAIKVLEYLKLDHLKDVPPVGMPYGILKKIELARTLMAGANLIILDEPAAGLNDQETIELAETIKAIKDEYNVTIFLVEHDMGLVMSICDHICAISFGKKLAYGTPQEIQKDPKVQEAYLGSEVTE